MKVKSIFSVCILCFVTYSIAEAQLLPPSQQYRIEQTQLVRFGTASNGQSLALFEFKITIPATLNGDPAISPQRIAVTSYPGVGPNNNVTYSFDDGVPVAYRAYEGAQLSNTQALFRIWLPASTTNASGDPVWAAAAPMYGYASYGNHLPGHLVEYVAITWPYVPIF